MQLSYIIVKKYNIIIIHIFNTNFYQKIQKDEINNAQAQDDQ